MPTFKFASFIKKAGLALLVPVILFALRIAGQEVDRGVPEQRIRATAGAPGAVVRRFDPRSASSRQILVRQDERTLEGDPVAIARLRTLPPGVIERVDYVTARCADADEMGVPNDVADLRRIEGLYRSEPGLFANTVRLGRIVQTGCQFDYQTQGWFRGLVVTTSVSFSAGNDESDLNAERLKRAREMEHKEGDWLDEARKDNAPGTPAPPADFRKGNVKPVAFDSKKIKTAAGGYTIDLSREPLQQPTICDGRLYAGSGTHGSTYHAFDLNAGRAPTMRWSVSLSDAGASRAVCGAKTIIFNTYSCTLFVLNMDTGAQLWSYFLGDLLPSAPSVAEGVVYSTYPSRAFAKARGATAPTHVLAAFNERDGRILWQRWIDSDGAGAPLVRGNEIMLTTFSGLVYKLARTNGDFLAAARRRATGVPVFAANGREFFLKRSERAGEPVAESVASLAADGGSPFVLKGRAAAYLDARSNGAPGFGSDILHPEASFVHVGRKSWDGMQNYAADRIVAVDDTLYVASGDALSAYTITGDDDEPLKVKWSLEAKGQGGGTSITAPAVVGDRLYAGTLSGDLLEIDAAGGNVIKKTPLGAAPAAAPVYDPGSDTLAVATVKGFLYVVNRK